MQCSLDEIEKKRRAALEKLAQKQSKSPGISSRERTFKSYSHSSKPYEKPSIQFNGKENVVTGKCSLITAQRFAVELSGFSTTAIDLFKTMPSRNYNVKTKHWDFDVQEHNLLISKAQVLRPNVIIEKIPSFVLNCVSSEKSNLGNIDLDALDPELACALMPFQEEGVRFGIDKSGRCLIADDMGLGKTFQALGIANYFIHDWPLLIVTTSSMKNVWEETIHKYLPSVPIMKVQYMTSGKDYIGDCTVLIVSHDMMSRYGDKLYQKNFGVLIVDESHTLKNSKAKCTQVAMRLSKKARRVILLSGTPALSRPSELYSQLSLIDDRFFGSFFDYSRRYCDGKNTHFGWDASGKSNLQELEILLTRKFMIRRTKEDVLKSLPNKIQEVITLDVDLKSVSEEDRKCLTALAVKYETNKKNADLLSFFSETAKIKIPSVCSYINQMLETNQKFLVFAHHQKMLDSISQVLQKRNIDYIRIDGNTTSEQRKYFVDKFQFDDNYLVAVLSITAANAGITLTAAQVVVFAELHWNPSILSQAESRAHRIGQEGTVVVKYLLAPGTADDSMWPIILGKQKILSEAGLSKDSFDITSVSKQFSIGAESLNGTLNKTVVGSLDISSYFKTVTSPSQQQTNEDSIFDDEFDDIFKNIDL